MDTKSFQLVLNDANQIVKVETTQTYRGTVSQPSTSGTNIRRRINWYALPAFAPEVESRLQSIARLPVNDQEAAGKALMLDVSLVHSIINSLSGAIMSQTSAEKP